MTLAVAAILASVESHVQTLGLFETVNLHEPKSKPGNGLTCAIWADKIGPLPSASGLAATAGLVVMNVRIYTPMLQEPYDLIDPNMVAAVDSLMAAFSGALTLDGNVRNVDLEGESGTSLSAVAGYINQDQRLMRVMTITLPMIVNDVWSQTS